MLSLGRTVSLVSKRAVSSSQELLKGHSKWQNIKATKGKNDLLKSQKINALLKRVNAACQEGGTDLKLNRKLADIQLEFKKAGLSLEPFNNAIARNKTAKS